MTRPLCARRSQVEGGRKRAAVCSSPPSGVGVGITVSESVVVSMSSGSEVVEEAMLG